ncbi:MAG TPA: isoleucine--tRNA ligase [Verrucomicrobiae bacterium]|jgi:isoleucyl-tRNA synthetase|nr:isoleucine--tRNA ligase [Verrucomicrobiae bacterium]
MTDYKDTLNLPRTGFAMKADLVAREPQRLAQWENQHLYQKIQARRAGAKRFVLHDGPPFANGDVHIGTALNKILKDMIVRYRSSLGEDAPYVPGWDCHGLPIEFKVTQEMRKAGQTAADPAAIRSACEASARKFIDVQRAQFKRLGVLGDWENPYLTLDQKYEADELRLFADVVERGLVYRGKKPVYWSIPCRTALAEAEVEYHDHTSQSIFVKFPVVGEPGTFVVIWTTTPWTLPANLAVAYNSKFTYSLARVGGEQYWILTSLLASVAEKCHWANYETVRTATGGELASLRYEHPFCRRTGSLLAGDAFVESSTGTGFVHIAPGHGLDDYNLGRQNGLPIYSPVDDDGCFAWTSDLPEDQQMPRELLGKSILERHGKSDANVAVLHELRARNALLHEENYHHSYPFCWRSKTPIIFRAMDQWFIGMDQPLNGRPFRQAALAEIDRVAWIPEWGVNRIKGAVSTRPDWCISRQRSWGVPIPAFYGPNGESILDPQIVRNVADLIEQHGSNIWFEKSAAELWISVKPKTWTGPDAASKSSDTLDVWIDSGSSSRAVLMRRPELAPQADVYLEGSDQHRGWFQSSLLLSLAGNGAAPFRAVLTHGFMVDADREKISKSKQAQGGYEKPQTATAYVSKYGADVVRLWVASQDYRNDIVVSDERINKVAETYRHLRNTLRYQLSNLYDFDPAKHSVALDKLTGIDRWILAQFHKLETEVAAAYERYEFHVVYQKASQFATVELSAIYHDLVKDRLYTHAANSPLRRSTQTALYRMIRGLCGMLSPILAFTTDEAWEQIPGVETPSVHMAIWERLAFELPKEESEKWEKLFQLRQAVLLQLEKERQAKNIGKALDAKVMVTCPAKAFGIFADKDKEVLRELLNVSQVTVKDQPDAAEVAVEVARAEGQKCERCWHWELDVGADAGQPAICGRCAAAVREVSMS